MCVRIELCYEGHAIYSEHTDDMLIPNILHLGIIDCGMPCAH